VWVLVLRESCHRKVRGAIDGVDLNEASIGKLAHERLDVAGVVREHLCLDPGRSVDRPTVTVNDRPEPCEEQARQRIALREYVVGEEARLD
jgi:hypothetical protein